MNPFPSICNLSAMRALRLVDVSPDYRAALGRFETAWTAKDFALAESLWRQCVVIAEAARREQVT